MTLTLEHRRVYGSDRYYPVCDQSRLIARIAGTETLTPSVIRCCRELGFDVVYKHRHELP